MDNKLRMTVFTPIYNRRHTIHRAFESLQNQTDKGFEWLVIDDGSTDGIKDVIDEYAKESEFTIRYYYKKNGGKHTAMNMAYGLTESEYFLVLDSDDALTNDAIKKTLKIWDSIPKESYEKYWCVTGLCIDSKNGEVIGDKYPEGINECENSKLIAQKISGDKTGCIRTDIIKKYPFPEPEGTTFITESIIWNKIEKEYQQYYSNEVLKIVYLDEPDSLSAAWYKNHIKEGYVSNYFWKLSTLNDLGILNRKDYKMFLTIPYYGSMAGKKTKVILGDVEAKKYKVLIAIMIIPAKLAKLIWGRRYLKGN